MTRAIVAVAALAVALCAFRCGPPEEPTLPPPPSDAAPDLCGEACANLAALGCPEAEPTTDGATCEAVCLMAETSGVWTVDPGCLAEITDCAGIDSCVWSAE